MTATERLEMLATKYNLNVQLMQANHPNCPTCSIKAMAIFEKTKTGQRTFYYCDKHGRLSRGYKGVWSVRSTN